MNKPTLNERRLELISRCAEQRAALADAVLEMRPSNVLGNSPVAGFVAGNRKTVLAAAAAMIGVMLARRQRIAALTGAVMTGMGVAKNALAVVRQFRR
jgi:hypothetical protein